MRLARIVLSACAVVHAGLALGQSSHFYERKGEGWWWRQQIEVVEAVEPDPPAATTSQAAIGVEPAPFSVPWLRLKLPELRDRAIEEPTTENVRAYFQLQRYVMDKAENFASMAQRVVLSDPTLDENNRRPLSTAGAQLFDELAAAEVEKLAAKIATEAGVWYFYKSDCPYCAAETPVLERLQRRVGLAVLPIALDGLPAPGGNFPQFVTDQGQAQSLGVTRTPTLFLVRDGKVVLLTEGLTSDEELLARMVFAAHEAGWVSDEELDRTRPVRREPDSIQARLMRDLSLPAAGRGDAEGAANFMPF